MTVTHMPTQTAAFLAAGCFQHLWDQVQDEQSQGCCPECCAPCSGLRALFELGQLDDLYAAYVEIVGGEHGIWDAAAGRVRRDWLIPAWSVVLGCHGVRGEMP
jgi:hypothetical protein